MAEIEPKIEWEGEFGGVKLRIVKSTPDLITLEFSDRPDKMGNPAWLVVGEDYYPPINIYHYLAGVILDYKNNPMYTIHVPKEDYKVVDPNRFSRKLPNE